MCRLHQSNFFFFSSATTTTTLILVLLVVIALSNRDGGAVVHAIPYEYVAELTSPSTSAGTGFREALIDPANNVVYIGTEEGPGSLCKYTVSPLAFVAREQASYPSATSPNDFRSAVIDLTTHYAYLGTSQAPSYVCKFSVSPSNFSFDSCILTATGNNWFYSAVIDPANSAAFFGSHISPTARVCKVDLTSFTFGACVDAAGGVSQFETASIDLTTQKAYFGTLPQDQVCEYNVSPSDFSLSSCIASGSTGYRSSVLDPENNFVYFGTNVGLVARYNTGPFSFNSSIDVGNSTYEFRSAVIDTRRSVAFFGTGNFGAGNGVGNVCQVDLATFTFVSCLAAPSGQEDFFAGVIDPQDYAMYFFGWTWAHSTVGKIVKLKYGTATLTQSVSLSRIGSKSLTAAETLSIASATFTHSDSSTTTSSRSKTVPKTLTLSRMPTRTRTTSRSNGKGDRTETRTDVETETITVHPSSVSTSISQVEAATTTTSPSSASNGTSSAPNATSVVAPTATSSVAVVTPTTVDPGITVAPNNNSVTTAATTASGSGSVTTSVSSPTSPPSISSSPSQQSSAATTTTTDDTNGNTTSPVPPPTTTVTFLPLPDPIDQTEEDVIAATTTVAASAAAPAAAQTLRALSILSVMDTRERCRRLQNGDLTDRIRSTPLKFPSSAMPFLKIAGGDTSLGRSVSIGNSNASVSIFVSYEDEFALPSRRGALVANTFIAPTAIFLFLCLFGYMRKRFMNLPEERSVLAAGRVPALTCAFLASIFMDGIFGNAVVMMSTPEVAAADMALAVVCCLYSVAVAVSPVFFLWKYVFRPRAEQKGNTTFANLNTLVEDEEGMNVIDRGGKSSMGKTSEKKAVTSSKDMIDCVTACMRYKTIEAVQANNNKPFEENTGLRLFFFGSEIWSGDTEIIEKYRSLFANNRGMLPDDPSSVTTWQQLKRNLSVSAFYFDCLCTILAAIFRGLAIADPCAVDQDAQLALFIINLFALIFVVAVQAPISVLRRYCEIVSNLCVVFASTVVVIHAYDKDEPSSDSPTARDRKTHIGNLILGAAFMATLPAVLLLIARRIVLPLKKMDLISMAQANQDLDDGYDVTSPAFQKWQKENVGKETRGCGAAFLDLLVAPFLGDDVGSVELKRRYKKADDDIDIAMLDKQAPLVTTTPAAAVTSSPSVVHNNDNTSSSANYHQQQQQPVAQPTPGYISPNNTNNNGRRQSTVLDDDYDML